MKILLKTGLKLPKHIKVREEKGGKNNQPTKATTKPTKQNQTKQKARQDIRQRVFKTALSKNTD